MNWDYFRTLGIVGFLALVIQLLVFVREKWFNATWRGLMVPVTLRQVLLEWATYILIFVVVWMALRGVFQLTCSIC
ncbi:MAG: hypothetical protein KGS09_13455 [Nitrospirae bacterium]|nr:hypothetical protein [Nitrospirota bacterium]